MFWLLYVYLVAIWVSVAANPAFQEPIILGSFTLLILIHGVLHSQVEQMQTPFRATAYVLVQNALIAAMVLLTGGREMVFSLYVPMAGEIFGLFPVLRQRLPALVLTLLAWAGSSVTTAGNAYLQAQLPWFLVAFAFVGIYVTLYNRQSTERARAEALLADLEAAHRQLRAYAARVEELTVTEERQRMARELHDTLAQGLAGLTMQLEAVDDLLSRGDTERARAVVGRALDRTRNTLQEARAAIQALRTPLERGDVVEAIRQLVENLRTETSLVCRFEAGPGELHMNQHTAHQLYRVAQEGLTNVARHARASQVTVRLRSEPAEIYLEIADDGVGFDPATALQEPGHYGLIGLRERIRLAGGTLQIESAPGQGTRLLATLPIAAAEQEG